MCVLSDVTAVLDAATLSSCKVICDSLSGEDRYRALLKTIMSSEWHGSVNCCQHGAKCLIRKDVNVLVATSECKACLGTLQMFVVVIV